MNEQSNKFHCNFIEPLCEPECGLPQSNLIFENLGGLR